MDTETAVLLVLASFAFIAILCLAAGWLWMMLVAFQTHPGWGFAVLLAYPWGSLAFAVGNWQRARWPALLTIAGLVGIVLMGISIPLLDRAGLKPTPRPTASPSARPAP